MTKLFQAIKEVTELQATSGHEDALRSYLYNKMQGRVDEIQLDGLGGIFGIKKSKDPQAKTVMVAAHMDEVGFMLAQVLNNGLLKVVPLGGWNPYVVSAQRFTMDTKQGKIPVISSSIPPHLLRGTQGQATPEVSEILFDAGFSSKEEAEAYGVYLGAPIVPESEAVLTANGKNVIAKAWDNRYGCLVIAQLLEELAEVDLAVNLVIGATVQEEVGLRGASAAATKFQPDLFFAVDCSAANDIHGGEGTFGKIGSGFLVRLQDPRFVMLPRLRDYVLAVAEKEELPYQYYISKGGTDAAVIHQSNEGIPSAVIGVVARYIHTHQSLFSLADYEAAKAEMKALLLDLTSEKVEKIIYGDFYHGKM